MKIYAVNNNDLSIRRKSSSGGVFSLLASQIINEGGVVYGASFNDEWTVVHTRADNQEDLRRLYGSKYAYSKLGNSVQDAIKDLKDGRKVLFSGTPCQAAIMRKFAGDHENLIIVEVVCHGTPEAKYWTRYLDEVCRRHNRSVKDISAINFRDKRTGWKRYSMTISFSDGEEITSFHGDNPYYGAFLHNLTLREACFSCPFKYPNGSQADITLGDFWKLGTIAPDLDNDEGTSLVIARTEKGERLLIGIELIREFAYDDIVKCNPGVASASMRPSKYDKFKKKAADESISIINLFESFIKPSLTLRLKIGLKKSLSALYRGN